MCGIVGMAGDLTIKSDKALKTLLILDAVRGIDSTGIAAIGKDGDTRVVKAVGNPYELIEHRLFSPTINRSNRVIIGHNRWATQGIVNRKNAHPFDFDTLVGVHNGTLTTKHRLVDPTEFVVDSENVFHHIEKKGLKDALNVMAGAWALVWWDKVAEELNILRNKERPLWTVSDVDNKIFFWASEKWMLEVALERAEIKTGNYHWVEEDMLYRVPVSDKGELGKAIVKYSPSTYAPAYNVHQQQSNFHKQQAQMGFLQGSGQATSTTNSTQSTHTSQARAVGAIQEKKGGTLTLVGSQQKKSQASSSGSAVRGYVSSKGVRLELVTLAVDSNGAPYIDCLDLDKPEVEVRIYYKKNDVITTQIGNYVIADIKDIRIHRTEGTYYKVARETVKRLELERINVRDIVDDINKDDPPFDADTVKDHKGREITKEKFNADYGVCHVCSGFVDPERQHKFAMNAEAICHECCEDHEIMKYINVM